MITVSISFIYYNKNLRRKYKSFKQKNKKKLVKNKKQAQNKFKPAVSLLSGGIANTAERGITNLLTFL